MIISIASGKGGTGKTTVAVNLAAVAGNGVKFLDCDVEAPNAHLFLNPVFEKTETITLAVPEVDESKCTLCGKCGEICQFKAIAVIPDTVVMTFPELCHSCGGCWTVCPEDAVGQIKRELGVVQIGRSGDLEFIHGRMRVGEAMSPPLITNVRSHESSETLTIIDAPPGTSCPVIAAMKDADFALLVTEPTPFGLHDLQLAAGAVKVLGLPSGLVINRSDIGDDRVRAFADSENLPVLLEIPFDRRIAEAYAGGKMLVNELPEYRDRFAQLYLDIRKMAEKS